MNKDQYEDYENELKDVGELIGTDININPSYYIHNAILKAQQALGDEDIKTAIVKFRFYCENIEILAKAGEMLPDDYEEKIKAFMSTEEYKKEEDLVRHFKLSNYKMQLLLGNVFTSKLSTSPMKA